MDTNINPLSTSILLTNTSLLDQKWVGVGPDGVRIGTICSFKSSGSLMSPSTIKIDFEPSTGGCAPFQPQETINFNHQCHQPIRGSICKMTCGPQYYHLGSSETICQPDGIWSTKLATCVHHVSGSFRAVTSLQLLDSS